MGKLKMMTTPDYVGGYKFGKKGRGGTVFSLTYKPHWVHRTMMRVCLGFYWINF